MDDDKRQEFVRLREEYAIQLRQERDALTAEVAEGEADLLPMESERANELEERAQQADATRMFIHLDERRKQRIDEIDQVLQRLALGTYGLCDRCGEPIPVARLRALPTARVHVQCAEDEERGDPVGTAGEEPWPVGEAAMLMTAEQEEEGPGGPEAEERVERMPPDTRSLNDEEVEEYLQERLEEDGRVDLHELQVSYHTGVLTLEGTLPSEEQHQMVLQYATDFAGIQEVVDRLVIDELLWEREDRTGRPQDDEASSGTLSGAMEELVESDQEGQDYEPPDRPVREET
jgi:DnaK suppressor protein